MSSVIEGYSYDIFISYRHKDNKGDRWVSEFVNSLRTELESTIKEEISVYFDENPHDSLLENHDIKRTLLEKLKCLIFIPILSQTYCDTTSYAWKYEFLTFIKMAMTDGQGRDIKLRNGNIASRILPVKIHELDPEDVRLFEKESCRPLRSIDFVFRTSAGVNRPLRKNEEHPNENLNNTIYRDQINKCANAIREIIQGIKSGQKESVNTNVPVKANIKKKRKDLTGRFHNFKHTRKLSGMVILSVLLVVISLSLYSLISRKNPVESLRSSDGRFTVAVMPFQNLTSDTTWNVWQEGIQDALINSLSNAEELRVRPVESVGSIIRSKGLTNYSSITPEVASLISQKLDASIVITGRIKKFGATLRFNAQLINSKNETVFKSFQIDESGGLILQAVDSLSNMLRNYLIMSRLQSELTPDNMGRTHSVEAYRYYIYGTQAFNKREYPVARSMFLHALAIDSGFITAQLYLPWTYDNDGHGREGKYWCRKVYENVKKYENSGKITVRERILANIMYSEWFESLSDEIEYLKQYIEVEDQAALQYWMLGNTYLKMGQNENAIPYLEKSLELYSKWGAKPAWIYNYTTLGNAYHATRQYEKEKLLYKKAEQDFPNDPDLIFNEAVLAFTEKHSGEAGEFISRYISLIKINSDSEADIDIGLARLYDASGLQAKAEEYFRKALSDNPDNPNVLSEVGTFLIYNRKTDEGLTMIDKAIALSPALDEDNYRLLHIKGIGLFMKGRTSDALKLFEESWKRRSKFDYALQMDIEKAKKVVEEKERNWLYNKDTQYDLFGTGK